MRPATSLPHRAPLPVLALLLAALAPAPGRAQADGRPMEVEDVLAMRWPRDVAISPDGRLVAYGVLELDTGENERRAHLWLAPADGGAPLQLTRTGEANGSPQWAPDGSWLGFLSRRDGKTQVWGIGPHGGEAWMVTDWAGGVGSFRISPDGRRIAFAAAPPTSAADSAAERRRGRPIVWDSAYAAEWQGLWVADLDDEGRAVEPARWSDDGHFVQSLAWAPDSRRVAYSARPEVALRTYRFADVHVAAGPARTERVTSMPGGESVVDWPAGLGLIVAGSGEELGTANTELWLLADGRGEPVPLTEALDENAGYGGATPDALLVEAAARTGRGLYRIPLRAGRPAGPPAAVSDRALFRSGFSATPDLARVAFVAESASLPPDVYVGATSSPDARRLTELNPAVATLALGAQRVVRWSSAAGGEEIEGVLTLPPGRREGERVPLLLVIHGGPAGVSSDRWVTGLGAYPIQVLAGRGYAVLQPNYRGSTGYGERFRGLNRGHISDTDWVDVDSGVDAMIEAGIADPARLGIMGWSFGGHHTFWGITRTDRYRAASAGAGANDLISMYAQTDLPEFYHTYLGPKPWEDFELYEERSAYRFVENVTTPLLIQVGEDDERVPAEQSIQFYEAMKAIGKAPVKLVVYPGQPHGVQEPRLLRDLMERNLEWFGRWIPPRGAAAEQP